MDSEFHDVGIVGKPVVFAVLFLIAAAAWAEPPETANIHGVLVDAEGTPLAGARPVPVITFRDKIRIRRPAGGLPR